MTVKGVLPGVLTFSIDLNLQAKKKKRKKKPEAEPCTAHKTPAPFTQGEGGSMTVQPLGFAVTPALAPRAFTCYLF